MTTENTAATPPPPAPKRRGPMRVVKWVLLTIVLLILVALGVLYFYLNTIVKNVVVKQSSNSLNTTTSLDSANLSLFGGKVSLKEFQVNSPSGFKTPQFMALGGVDVKASLGELRSDPIRVDTINIDSPRLVIEMQGTNFNIKKFIDALPPGEDKPTDDGKKPIKLVIGNLKLQGAQVVFKPDVAALSAMPGVGQSMGGLKSEYVLTIPPLEMQNIGSGEGNQNGAAIKEVVTLIVTQLAAKASQSEQLPPELRQVLSMNVNEITNMVKAKLGEQVNKQLDKISGEVGKKLPGEAGKTLEGIIKNPQGAATNPTQTIEQGLGGLLNKQKKSPPATQPK